MSRAKDGYRRIVVYQPRNGACTDLMPSEILAPRFSSGEGYFASSAGTNRAVNRTRAFEIPVIDNDKVDQLRLMHFEGCEMRAIGIGWDSHLVWELDSEINLVPFRGGPRSFAGERLVFNTDVMWGSVYQSDNILGGIPWACQDATLDSTDNNYYLPGPNGYQGNRWKCTASTDTVSAAGVLSGSVTLTMHFPFEGATVQMSGNWQGSLETLDYSGVTLTTFSKGVPDTTKNATIDDGTWKITVTVTSANIQPLIYVTVPGDDAGDRYGVCIDCTDLSATASSAPAWSS